MIIIAVYFGNVHFYMLFLYEDFCVNSAKLPLRVSRTVHCSGERGGDGDDSGGDDGGDGGGGDGGGGDGGGDDGGDSGGGDGGDSGGGVPF